MTGAGAPLSASLAAEFFVILATAVLAYEQGLPGMLIALRSAATAAIIVKLIEIIRVRRDLRHSASLQDHWHRTCHDNMRPEERQFV